MAESNRSRKPKVKPVASCARTGEKRVARASRSRKNKKVKREIYSDTEDEDEDSAFVAEDLPRACRKGKSKQSGIIVKKENTSMDEGVDENGLD